MLSAGKGKHFCSALVHRTNPRTTQIYDRPATKRKIGFFTGED